VQPLLGSELVDRLTLWVSPVLLGSGKRRFAEGTVPTALRLVASATFPKGAVQLSYERAGTPTSPAWPRRTLSGSPAMVGVSEAALPIRHRGQGGGHRGRGRAGLRGRQAEHQGRRRARL
jgi:hypothetical protein